MPRKRVREKVSAATRARPRKRLPANARKQEFIDNAVAFFAESGFGGSTRELARRLNVSQPLLYRYFPSKEDLVREVYKRVYLGRWNAEWDDLLADRSIPLRERLEHFYDAYTNAIFERSWLRIFFFSGLKGGKINKWYLRLVEDRILKPIVREIRAEHRLPETDEIPIDELALAWLLHGGVFYYGIRKFIYKVPVPESKSQVIANAVQVFLEGMRGLLGARPHFTAAALRPAAE